MSESTSAYPKVYLAAAEQLILDLPEGEEFMAADVLSRMRADGWADLPEPRRTGPMLLKLKSRGFVRKVEVRSAPARSHGGHGAIWCRTGLRP